MGLTDVQRALTRLYTDRALRERFFADPPSIGPKLGINPEETAQLESGRESICRFARSLQIKRLGEAGRFLPATRRALGTRYAPLFLEYAVTAPPAGTRKPQEDALRFSRYLLERVPPDSDPWLADLARFESAWIAAATPSFRLLIRRFRWPVHRLIEEQSPAALTREAYLGIWVRLGRQGRLRHYWLRLGGTGSPNG